MGIDKRFLLVCPEDTLATKLDSSMKLKGWQPLVTTTYHEANTLLEDFPCRVGVLCLDESDKAWPCQEAEALVSSPQHEWIALISPDALSSPLCRQRLKHFCFAYHTLPVNTEQLDCVMQHALAMADLATPETDVEEHEEYEMVGTTPEMRHLFQTIRRVASVDTPVFIHGESGTGKELAAQAIHERSDRADGPFVAVNCGALPSNLIQSELFGHEKGAFTGASQRKIGKIEAASGGTLFLDEIGDLPLDTQVNLLRFLENHIITRVGDIKEHEIDVRIVAATHINLEDAVRNGNFREDLYHRLNVLRVEIPPLRERQDDIEILANFFFKKFSAEKAPNVKGFRKESLALMRSYEWPGNIRELINRVRRAMVMCDKRLIRPVDMGLERRCNSRGKVTLEEARNAAERKALISALARNRFHVSKAAKDVGVSRVTLYRLIDKHELSYVKEELELRCDNHKH